MSAPTGQQKLKTEPLVFQRDSVINEKISKKVLFSLRDSLKPLLSLV
jgi:hypothetical protein